MIGRRNRHGRATDAATEGLIELLMPQDESEETALRNICATSDPWALKELSAMIGRELGLHRDEPQPSA